jgi:hypothetical protein
MKKIYTFLAAMVLAGASFGQYYYNPFTKPGMNPGNLNNDSEFPVGGGIPAGWTTVLAPSASATWSNNINIPFAFNFNGSPVTEYKVSNSGVVTFSTASGLIPGFANTAIPSASIPDNSVMVWGIEGIQANDNVVTKTFGTAPNRQYWISFNSFSKGAAANWTYWSVVLEETSNKIYIVDQRHSGNLTGLTVGIQTNSSTAYAINNGGANVSTLAGADPLPDDNVYYEFIQGTRPQFDLAMAAVNLPEYVSLALGPVSLTGTVNNMGAATVNAYTLSYSVNNAAPVSVVVNPGNLASLSSHNFTHTTPWTPASTGIFSIKVWSSNINGNPDMNNSNDTVTKTVFVASSLAQRKALFEQFTSSTCGPCASSDPAVTAFLGDNGANTAAGKVVAIKYHQNYPSPGTDAAFTQEARDRHDYYGVTGIPRAVVGGTAYNGHPASLTQPIVDAEYSRPAVFEIEITEATYSGNLVNVKGKIKSLADINAGLRLHVVVLEDMIDKSVVSFPGGTTSQTKFKYVMRKMLTSSGGQAMAAYTSNQTTDFNFSHTFGSPNETIFAGMDGLTVAAFIQNGSTKTVFQATQAKIIDKAKLNINELSAVSKFNVYPNPAKSFANIEFDLQDANDVNIQIINSIGQVVYSENKGMLMSGEHTYSLNVNNFTSGVYFVKLTSGNHQMTKKISIVE